MQTVGRVVKTAFFCSSYSIGIRFSRRSCPLDVRSRLSRLLVIYNTDALVTT